MTTITDESKLGKVTALAMMFSVFPGKIPGAANVLKIGNGCTARLTGDSDNLCMKYHVFDSTGKQIPVYEGMLSETRTALRQVIEAARK